MGRGPYSRPPDKPGELVERFTHSHPTVAFAVVLELGRRLRADPGAGVAVEAMAGEWRSGNKMSSKSKATNREMSSLAGYR